MAVREVNLIPAETLLARHLARRIRMWAILMILIPILIWGIYGVAAARILSQRQVPHDVSELRREYGLLVAEVNRLELELNEAVDVQDLFHAPASSRVLNALAEVVPADVQVASCAIHGATAGNRAWRLVLTGQSNSHSELGEFVKALEAHTAFDKVSLTLSRSSQAPGVPSDSVERPMSGYRIECMISPPGGSA